MPSWMMQSKSAIAYGAAMVASVAFFLLASPSLADKPASWIAGVASAVAALLLGWWLGRWYLPVQGERPTFELLLCPVAVVALSLVLGLATLSAWGLVVGPPESRPLMGLGAMLYFGVLVFLSVAWPAVAVTFGAAGIWLARCSRSAPNNSLQPKPLRGSA